MAKTILQKKQGKLTTNGVILEKHEIITINFFLNLGRNIELIRPSLTPRSRNADFIMDSLAWEMKSPKQVAHRSIERIFYEATRQSANVVFDLRRIRNSQQPAVITLLQERFQNTRKIRRLYIITSEKDFHYLQK